MADLAPDQKYLNAKMEILANKFADRMIEGDVIDPDTNAGFKVLTTYYISTRKLAKVPDTEDGPRGSGFDAARKRIAAASNGIPVEGDHAGPAANDTAAAPAVSG